MAKIVHESNSEYHGNTSAISKSRLSKMSICPRYFKWCEDNPQEPTEDLVVGSAFHKLVLEGETFGQEFVVMPQIDRRTNNGKALYNEFMTQIGTRHVITAEQYNMITGMANSISCDKYANVLLNGEREVSMYYTDELTGIECKVRPDCYKVIGDKVIITDLKSCRSAVGESFMKDIVNYSYDLQAYMYRLGVSKVLGVPIENVSFVFVPIEKKEPYLMAMYEVTQDIFDRGEMLYRKYLGELKYCRDTNNWYGYNGFSNKPTTIGLPDWVTKNKNIHDNG